MAQRSAHATAITLAVCFAFSAQALGQPPPARGPTKPPAAPPSGAPPGTGTDMEIDPDAKPPEPPKKEEKELPPPEAGAWGVGGKDEEGKYAPPTKKKVEDTDEDKGPVKLGPPGAVGLDMVVGFGSMLDVTNHTGANNGRTLITALSFVIGAKYRFGESFTLKARLPITNASITPPTGPVLKTNAVGNVEIGAEYAIGLTRRLRLPIDLAIDIPSAAGDLFGASPSNNVPYAQALVNQAAMVTRGWEDNPLFASKRFGFRLGAGITYDRNALHVAAGTRMDIMGKTSGAPGGGGVTIRTPNFAWVTTAQLFYDFFDGKLSPGLRAWLAVAKAPVYSMGSDYSGAQFVVEPDVRGTFGLNADGSLAIRGLIGFILPVAGPIGGADGFRARAEFLF